MLKVDDKDIRYLFDVADASRQYAVFFFEGCPVDVQAFNSGGRVIPKNQRIFAYNDIKSVEERQGRFLINVTMYQLDTNAIGNFTDIKCEDVSFSIRLHWDDLQRLHLAYEMTEQSKKALAGAGFSSTYPCLHLVKMSLEDQVRVERKIENSTVYETSSFFLSHAVCENTSFPHHLDKAHDARVLAIKWLADCVPDSLWNKNSSFEQSFAMVSAQIRHHEREEERALRLKKANKSGFFDY